MEVFRKHADQQRLFTRPRLNFFSGKRAVIQLRA